MFLMFLGRDPNSESVSPYEAFGLVLNDMVSEGLIEEAKLDAMNMPRYAATPDEVIDMIESEGSFTLQKLEAINNFWDGGFNKDNGNHDPSMSADFIAKHGRATTEPMLKAEFGEGVIDEIFVRCRKMLAMKLEQEMPEFTMLILFMTKK
ncbi:hypothetical protein PIB30_113579 [Stylosanthes scabra]|uniref:Uncharacterized protein n=1 Tax=Stylosanthes scabra TaxID=79078 RepID=A0ABU7A0M0_9FABA|nr:hypothetical protein [Stylosanthes scabra]